MSLADELLNSIASGDTETYAADATSEQHIVINPDRTVVVPENLKKLAVQFDHNIETVTFDCPRYWDGLDMSQMNVYVNYIRSDNQTGAYPATVTSANETTMQFNWTISREVTEVKGTIAFLVCVKKVVDGAEVNHWNSELCRECYISEGLEAEAFVADQYPDIITQLLTIAPDIGKIDEALSRISDLQESYMSTAALDNIITTQENYIGGDAV